MKVRIIKPAGGNINGVSLRYYKPGSVYDLNPSLAEYLVAEGYAFVEMRGEKPPKPAAKSDRRRKQ